MKKMLNTLYITTPESYIKRDGENIVVTVEGKPPFRAPIHLFESIVYFGYLGASPGAIALCMQHGVTISMHSQSGRFIGRVEGPVSGNVLLRRQQYRLADIEPCNALVSQNIVLAKLLNSRTVLQRARRDHAEKIGSSLDRAIDRLQDIGKRESAETRLNIIRGYEGDGAQAYFGVFNAIILQDKQFFFVDGRTRRPPLDPVNALLSYMYSILAHDCKSALESVGLDPAVGFLHRDRPGRSSLALDLMEEFRACLVDRFVVSLINRKQLDRKDFVIRENGAVAIKDEARKLILAAWQDRKQDSVYHPWIKESVQIGLLPYVQALLMARYVRGDLDIYPAYIWR